MSVPGSVRVLLVEGDGDDADLVARALSRGGWEATMTRVQVEGDFRAALGAGRWDLVISDMSERRFSARRALELLREADSEVPVIVFSETVGDEAAADVLRLGAADFVSKGNMERLSESIGREMRQQATRHDVRAAAQSARESEERLDAFVHAAMDAIVSCDEEQRIVLFNPAAERVFGWTAAEAIGERLDTLLPERYRWIHSGHVRDFGISGITNRTMANLAPLSGRRKDGSEFPIEVTISQAKTSGKRFYTAVVRDISERRRLESELMQAQKMEAIGRLAGGIAHDFNNLLTAISGYTEIAMMETEDSNVEGSLREVLGAAERAAALTRQLLTLSRKQPPEVKVLDPNQVVGEIYNILHRVLGEDIELVSSLDDRVGHIRADQGQLNQVLLNLAVNARDAMPDGGRLEIRTAVRVFERGDEGAPSPGSYAAIAVIDTGTGIAEEDRAHIFEPFYTTKPQGKGTGLGLSIVRTIVDAHQGVFMVEDAPARGTCFTIFFPTVGGELDARRTPTIAAQSMGSETVMLIEDDESLRALETLVLRRHGYTVHSFSRPSEALSAAIPDVDMLVADVVLPGMSGPTAAVNLRRRWPGLRVLFLSGYTGDSLSDLNALPEGHSLLQKPFSIDELARRVRDLLDEHAAS